MKPDGLEAAEDRKARALDGLHSAVAAQEDYEELAQGPPDSAPDAGMLA